MKENTGNYRVCRHKIGIGNSIEVMFEFNDRNSAIAKKKEIDKDAIWNYYCEEEVIYKGTQKDQNNNPINSSPSWVRI
jgi:hypothetical protein